MERFISVERLEIDLIKLPLDMRGIVRDLIAEEPVIDAVEVVRCKDCKWYDLTDPCGTLTPNAHRCKRVTRLWMEDDAYCSYGERRE